MSKKITVIPAKSARAADTFHHTEKKRRVCAYARVSTNDEEQRSSHRAQVSKYTQMIQENKDWEFVAVFTELFYKVVCFIIW